MIWFHLNLTDYISQIRHTIGHTWKCKTVSANSLLCFTSLSFLSPVIYFLMCVFWRRKPSTCFAKQGLEHLIYSSLNKLHTVNFSALGSAVLCSHSSSPTHPFPDSELCGRVTSGHQLDPKVRAVSLVESSLYLIAGLAICVYIL